jgi:antitoxin MazE
MRRRVQRWGNSLAVRLPAHVTEAFDLHEGTELDVREEAGAIVLVPERQKRGTYTLRQLVGRITSRNRPAIVDFGRPKGREIW